MAQSDKIILYFLNRFKGSYGLNSRLFPGLFPDYVILKLMYKEHELSSRSGAAVIVSMIYCKKLAKVTKNVGKCTKIKKNNS